ncbi:MAG: TRC40/GET3/ArsA family transport-energizing ATPase, partial [Gammaproteobacteria bacterium]|nr:TRC40/GET3/ArsA family transport-energizing ATPase [Gammaproteobacteria bacterium]
DSPPRIILLAGKGGVGKTTIAAATGLACARSGKKTLIISLDAAHSLADSFDVPAKLHDKHQGLPLAVAERLEIQELDVQEEIVRYWGEVYQYVTSLLASTGLEEVVAEELAVFPGMDDVVGLLYLNKYAKEKSYDVVILDCAPTGEALRFISMPQTLDWYYRKFFKLERNLMRLARPIVKRTMSVPIPEDKVYQDLESLFLRLEGVDQLLLDNSITTVRLVTNAEKMVIKETQRAFMYFSLYRMTTDAIIVNRLFPEAITDDYYRQWILTQKKHLREIEEIFAPVPVRKVRLFEDEILGIERLNTLSGELFADLDPAAIWYDSPPDRFTRGENGEYLLQMHLPFVSAAELQLHREKDDLIVRVGNYKRQVQLPRVVRRLAHKKARISGGELYIEFGAEEVE